MTSSMQNSLDGSSSPLSNIDLGQWDDTALGLEYAYSDFVFTSADPAPQGSTSGRLASLPSGSPQPGVAGEEFDYSVLLNDLPSPTNNELLASSYPDPALSERVPYYSLPNFGETGLDLVVRSGFDHVRYAEFPPTAPEPSVTRSPATRSSAARTPPAAPASKTSSPGRASSRRRSSDSSDGAEALPRQDFTRERPKYDPKHPWHRINNTTQGLTTRTGKINQYAADEVYKQGLKNPFVPWSTPNCKFDYFEHGELSQLEYNAGEVKEFIYHHPVSDDKKLLIWIQKTPADSGRRYPTPTLAKCRFKECPLRRERLNGTIATGHMRVALDERSHTYGDEKADPFYMAAIFHLYCFERFLDLPEICTLANVEVRADTRQLANEPKLKWNASLSSAKEGLVAKRFIDACRKGRSTIKGFDSYPRPHNMLPGADKPHKHMLNHRMQQAKEGNRSQSSKDMLLQRVQRSSQLCHNLGDLEMMVSAKVSMRKPARKPKARISRKRRRSSSFWNSDDGNDAAYVSDDDAETAEATSIAGPSTRSKKRRTDNGPSGGVVAAAEPPATDPAYSAAPANHLASVVNNNANFGYGHPQYAWPQYTMGQDAADIPALADGGAAAPAALTTANLAVANGTGISAVDPRLEEQLYYALADPALDPTLTGPSNDTLLPSYPLMSHNNPPMGGYTDNFEQQPSSDVRHTSVAVPNAYPFEASFTLSNPKKRSATAADNDDNSTAQQLSPRKRRRTSYSNDDDDTVSPKNPRLASMKSPATPSPRRSSRLSSMSSGSGAAGKNGDAATPTTAGTPRRSSRLSSLRSSSSGRRSSASLDSLGSLFEED